MSGRTPGKALQTRCKTLPSVQTGKERGNAENALNRKFEGHQRIMSWRRPDIDDIYATLTKDEVEIYRTSANWTEDPIKRLLNRSVAFVRGKLKANGNVRMSPNADEIPESTISPAMDYLAFDILKRLGGKISEERKEARREAVRFFERVANREETPESYGQGENGVSGGSSIEVVTSSRLRSTSNKLEGL